jgi:hypothetical protein
MVFSASMGKVSMSDGCSLRSEKGWQQGQWAHRYCQFDPLQIRAGQGAGQRNFGFVRGFTVLSAARIGYVQPITGTWPESL